MASVILVPQGAEYQAVCQGIQSCIHPPKVVSIPVGIAPVMHFLKQNQWQDDSSVIIVMGLCGSLSPHYQIGDGVIYQACVDDSGKVLNCDRALSQRLQARLQVSSVKAFTSDRVVWSAAEKQALAQTHQAAVVDMEGIAVLSTVKAPIAMVRVISDDAQSDLPDVTSAIDTDGTLQPIPLAIAMVRHPIGAVRLIRGSLAGLHRLRSLAQEVAIALQA